MKRRSCFAMGLLACACAQGAPRATLELLPQAEVTGDTVSLGQIAHLRSPELALVLQLVHLPVGRVPRDGQPAFVRRELLAQWVQRETGLAAEELAWQGSEVARVNRVTRHVSGAELAQAATGALRPWLAQRGFAAEPHVARAPRDIDVPAGEIQLRPRPLDGAALRNRLLVWVEVWSEGAFVRAVPVAVELERGFLAAAPASRAAGATLALPARSPALPSPVLVERGAWATLRSTDGVVSLESKVAVLQDGRAGEHVRVRAPGGGGIVFARVVGPAQLELAP
jgi:flagella basal body P-ring formation protein FlgA